VDEFFADKPERPIALPTGQALVLKVPSEKNRQSLTRKSDDREDSEDHFGREA
jgi:hypothetical protein